MYLAAIASFWGLGYLRIRSHRMEWTVSEFNDLCFYGAFGVIVGGRLGFVFFYGLEQFLDNPAWLFFIWEGGMSFHGGLIGVIAALVVFCKVKQKSFWSTADTVAPLVPIGLGLGRIGNFINTELPGRITDSPLGMHFPCRSVRDLNFLCTGEFEEVARHVSSLYQAVAEGVVLFVVLWLFSQKRRPLGQVSAAFLVCYGVIRILTEFFRQPDAQLGFVLFEVLSMGQTLSLVMILGGIGIWLMGSKQTDRRGSAT